MATILAETRAGVNIYGVKRTMPVTEEPSRVTNKNARPRIIARELRLEL
ncbi:MAG TPA: hypothetical protein VIG62_17965 [Blastocatellia bacterium]